MQKNFLLRVLLSSHMKRICGGDVTTCQGGRGMQEKFGERDSQPLTNEEMLQGRGERRPGTPGPQTARGTAQHTPSLQRTTGSGRHSMEEAVTADSESGASPESP